MNRHCCHEMEYFLQEGKVSISYSPRFREYAIDTTSGAKQLMAYCPWCGSTLPKNLGDKYFEEMERLGYGELGVLFTLNDMLSIGNLDNVIRSNIQRYIAENNNTDADGEEMRFTIADLPVELTPFTLIDFKTDAWWITRKM